MPVPERCWKRRQIGSGADVAGPRGTPCQAPVSGNPRKRAMGANRQKVGGFPGRYTPEAAARLCRGRRPRRQ